jgi:nucleotide-binding universal stress UspA family protein
MALDTVIVCTDGSELASRGVQAGFALLAPARRVIVVTVTEPTDATLVTGTGFAGGVISPEEYDALNAARLDEAKEIVASGAAELGADTIETRVLAGYPGPSICTFAAEIGASAIVMGTRGRSGIKRALLGSVSDYVVRNATCPVVITAHND